MISIITPSFRSGQWLRLCIASVADQTGVQLEHIVQDAGSDDGTLDWLPQDSRVRACVEPDAGMYDALNRGLRKSRGEILAHLNCDEQYLPGTLQAVEEFFAAHPKIEVVFAHAVVVDALGEFICCRKAVPPRKCHTLVCHLTTLTCATFFRRRIIEERGLWFDASWRALGDGEWVARLRDQGVPVAILPRYTSVFTGTSENMSLKPNAMRERERLFQMAPWWARRLALGLQGVHWLRRLAHGNYWQRPFHYTIYTLASPTQRVEFHVAHPTFMWKERMQAGLAHTVRMSMSRSGPGTS